MTTPVRQQYLRIKKQFPDTIVLFRLGDFYETFDDDAKIVSSVCNIVLTGRDMGTGNRVPLAGVPYHAVETYLAKLVQAGHKVAIVEQSAEEPAQGLMNREVARVVTPGTVVEPTLLQDKANNYLAAVYVQEPRAAIAHADITTGEFAVAELDAREVIAELERLHPAEVLAFKEISISPHAKFRFPVSLVPPFDDDAARQLLLDHFQVASLDGFGLSNLKLAPRTAATILRYLTENQKGALAQLRGLRVYSTDQFMALDPPTRRNLELTASIRGGGIKGSLLGVLDETKTAMGGRLLRQWLTQPLCDMDALNRRLDRVDEFYRDTLKRERIRALLKHVGDVERLTNRVVQGIASPREVRTLGASLGVVPALQKELETTDDPGPPHYGGNPAFGGTKDPAERGARAGGRRTTAVAPQSSVILDACIEVSRLVDRALVADPPANLANGGVIAPGYSAELDSITLAARNAKDWVAALERTERERTGIKSLKVGYNRVFGYYLEVTTSNISQVPDEYIRKQTLANAERYITPELKEYESLILNAEERLVEIETLLFRELCGEIAQYATRLLNTARAVAELDVYSALAEVAVRCRYVRPVLDDGGSIDIHAGRHPVVELALQDMPFVPNDCCLSGDELIHIITGPNMSGKTVFIRQNALIVLMAQIGSFVPAESARIGIVDRIFTRIGAEDAISAGQSTFMVEMVETANILNHCTRRSLIVLDEIGRGTSTYDGIAIARAVVEYIHNHPRLGAKTLFATHYHELIELENYLPKVRNYNVAVIEQAASPASSSGSEQIVFLHKIVRGGADKSYGIHVAQLAGVPRPVVSRAQEILQELEQGERQDGRALEPIQLRLFSPDDDWRRDSALRKEIAALDLLALSPLEALNKLFELQRKAKES